VTELVLGPPVEFPDDLVMYVATSWCANCGWSPGNLWRIYRNREGNLVADHTSPDGYVPLYALSSDASEIIAGICTGYCGGEGYPSEDASLRFVVSRDGGITWQPINGPTFARTYVAFSGWFGGQVVANAIKYLPSNRVERVDTFLVPSFARLELPPGLPARAPDTHQFPQAFVAPGGRLLWGIWQSSSRPLLFDEKGSPASLGGLESVIAGMEWRSQTYGQTGFEGISGVWFPVARDRMPPSGLLVAVDGNGEPVAGYVSSTPGVTFATRVSNTEWLGTAILPVQPGQPADGNDNFRAVLIDTTTGLMHPINGLPRDSSPLPGNFTWPRLALAGKFLRVSTGGDCLNVREVPGKSSVAALGCFRDGVLLRLRPEPEQPFDGTTWLAVATPDGRAGWASAEFLER
jgi:hypothetical protein